MSVGAARLASAIQPDIRNDGAVRPRAFEKTEIFFRRREIGVARENIDRHVEFSAKSVRVFHRLGEFAVGKVARLRAEGKILPPTYAASAPK